MKFSARHRYILLAVLAYLVLALTWILLSDRLLAAFADPEAMVRLSTAKGIFFVLASGTCFAVAILGVPNKTEPTTERSEESLLDALAIPAWPRWSMYLLAVALTLAMFVVRKLMPVAFADRPLLVLYMLPIIIAALLGGFGPGLVATLTAAVLAAFFFIPPVMSLAIVAGHDLFQLALLVVNGLVVSLISATLHRSRRRELNRRMEVESVNAALRQSEERLALFIEHAPAALAMFDRDMRYLAASRRWRGDYALGDHVLIGRCHYDVFPEIGEEWRSVHRRGLAGEVIRCDEDPFVRGDGRIQWLRWEVWPWHDASGNVGGVLIFSEDITRFKEAQEEIRRLNVDLERRVVERTAELTAANRELDSFAYAVSHDLRAPLRAMSGFAQALVEDYGERLDGEAALYLDQIQRASGKMGALIDGLLALSRSTRSPLRNQPVDLSRLAELMLTEMAKNEPNRQVRWQIEPHLIVHGDRVLLAAALDNLLANAWKFTAHRLEATIRVFAKEDAGQRRICIADNGAGFDPAHADKLFQPFQRLHRQNEFPGIGIGLATVQRIIHRHGGTLTASGAPDKGAIFCIGLPADDYSVGGEEP